MTNREDCMQKRRMGIMLALAILLGGLGWWKWNYNPLMRDEAMIEHFHQHRAELEKLVAHYRAYPQENNPVLWDAAPEIQALKQKAGVRWLSEAGPGFPPNPYSEESAYLREQLSKEGKYGFKERRQISNSIRISLWKGRNGSSWLRGYGWIWKEYGHSPEVPKIEGGKLWHAWGVAYKRNPTNPFGKLDTYVNKTRFSRVFDSLNGYPPHWRRGECVFRPIEPHWFIVMCRA